jgi:hypothetical protein
MQPTTGTVEYFVHIAPAISAFIAALGVLLAAIAGISSYFQYVQSNTLKRFEKFQEMNARFVDGRFLQICHLLETDDDSLGQIPFEAKLEFLGFYEEVALMRNSKLLNDQVAYYMLGYYAIRCNESKTFWTGVNKDAVYWCVFNQFASEMKRYEDLVTSGKMKLDNIHF